MKRWRGFKGLTMLELVLAMGLMFVSASGVMMLIVAGAGYPRRTQYGVIRDGLAKIQLDAYLNDVTMWYSASTFTAPYSSGYFTYPANPDYQYKLETTPTTFDSRSAWLKVTVKGPIPEKVESSIQAVYTDIETPQVGQALFTSYGCNGCHALSPNPAVTAPTPPTLGGVSLNTGLAQRNAALGGPPITLPEYIRESIRTPDAFLVPGYTVAAMSGYPRIKDMPEADLRAIRNYLQSLPP
ncbi:MAG: hypothetical protein U0931_18740 [Vulcanimicrobiota bacterium]